VSEFGRIDVLFNLAGRSHFAWLENVTDQEWDAARRDEVDLIFYLTRAAWPHLMASRGVVVNMASLNGQLSFKLIPSLSHTTNKAAIIGMTRQFALEGAEHGIRVNSISPGLMVSNATRGSLRTSSGPARCVTGHCWAGSASRRTWPTSRCSWPVRRAPT
jgi:NAD(P)-dependent dehydrogenase (short-subunit alcohol dehydrogenase family)